jgi:hypothetical protein
METLHFSKGLRLTSKSPYTGELRSSKTNGLDHNTIRIRSAGKDHRPGDTFFVVLPDKRGNATGVFETVMPYPRADCSGSEDVELDLRKQRIPVPISVGEDDDTPLKYDELATALETKRCRRFMTVTVPPDASEGQAADVSTPKGTNNVKTTIPVGFTEGQVFVVGYEALVSIKKTEAATSSMQP